MIRVEEFRPGNYFFNLAGQMVQWEYDSYEYYFRIMPKNFYRKGMIKGLHPVIITEELLDRTDFKQEWRGIYKWKDEFRFYFIAGGSFCVIEPRLKKDTSVEIASKVLELHRLQNLMFDLRGVRIKIRNQFARNF